MKNTPIKFQSFDVKEKEVYKLLKETLEYICEPAYKRMLKKRSELIERGKIFFPKLIDNDK